MPKTTIRPAITPLTVSAARQNVQKRLREAGFPTLLVSAAPIVVNKRHAVLVLISVPRGDVPAAPEALFDLVNNTPGPRQGGYCITLW